MHLIDIIAGARPNFMKIAPIIRAIKDAQSSGGAFEYRLVHTGQHYDERMSARVFSSNWGFLIRISTLRWVQALRRNKPQKS
jgi:UDP-N-acetylglucosamine 2-epimerase